MDVFFCSHAWFSLLLNPPEVLCMSEFVGSTLKGEDIAYFCHAVYVAELKLYIYIYKTLKKYSSPSAGGLIYIFNNAKSL